MDRHAGSTPAAGVGRTCGFRIATRELTAEAVVAALEAARSDEELVKVRARLAEEEPAFGLRMGDLFAVAKDHRALPLDECTGCSTTRPMNPAWRRSASSTYRRVAASTTRGGRRGSGPTLSGNDRITTRDMMDRAAPGWWARH